MAKKYTNRWKNRSSYGTILYRKIHRFDKLLKTLNKKESLTNEELEKYLTISKTQDYSIQVQLSNIKVIEDFEILEKMERARESETGILQRAKELPPRIF